MAELGLTGLVSKQPRYVSASDVSRSIVWQCRCVDPAVDPQPCSVMTAFQYNSRSAAKPKSKRKKLQGNVATTSAPARRSTRLQGQEATQDQASELALFQINLECPRCGKASALQDLAMRSSESGSLEDARGAGPADTASSAPGRLRLMEQGHAPRSNCRW